MYISCKGGEAGLDGAKGSTTKCASILGSAPCSKNIGGGPIKLTLLKREKNRKKEKLSRWNPPLYEFKQGMDVAKQRCAYPSTSPIH